MTIADVVRVVIEEVAEGRVLAEVEAEAGARGDRRVLRQREHRSLATAASLRISYDIRVSSATARADVEQRQSNLASGGTDASAKLAEFTEVLIAKAEKQAQVDSSLALDQDFAASLKAAQATAIAPVSTEYPSTSSSGGGGSNDGGLSVGALAGIAVAAGVLLVVGAAVAYNKKKHVAAPNELRKALSQDDPQNQVQSQGQSEHMRAHTGLGSV